MCETHSNPLPGETGPGAVLLFGSGETSPSGRKAFDMALSRMAPAPRVALLETPAGFELNSDRVIGRVAEFIAQRLQNYQPQVQVVPARRRGTPFSPDSPEVAEPLLAADLIFMGPGSPSYTVRQLRDSLAWQYLTARHRLGGVLALASAAAIAISAYSLPVYEIYKVGEDLHWKEGLDLFGPYGLPLVFIPHWNNQDGGTELDTSRCFMGQERFASLMELLPADLTVVGIDEGTALLLDLPARVGRVTGLGGVTLLHTGHRHRGNRFGQHGSELEEVVMQRNGHSFPLSIIGEFRLPDPSRGLPAAVWEQAVAAGKRRAAAARGQPSLPGAEAERGAVQPETGLRVEGLPTSVRRLLAARQAAREEKDWAAADQLREELAGLGWTVVDTRDGQQVTPKP